MSYTVSASGKITFDQPKDPSNVCDYAYDWTAFLGTDSAVTSAVVVTGATKVQESLVGNKSIVRVSGGTTGVTFSMQFTVTTTAGCTYQRTLYAKIKER